MKIYVTLKAYKTSIYKMSSEPIAVYFKGISVAILTCMALHSMHAQRFAAIGDYGSGNENEAAVAELINEWDVDFIITLGDNNYPNGAAATIDENIGQYFSDYIFPYAGAYGSTATENNFYPALGNHEYYTAGALPHLDYFELPGNERYYDYVRGNVHFFVLNSDIAEQDGIDQFSIQAQWLQANLENSSSIWNVVYMHEPPYSTGLHEPLEVMRWPFHEWGVDAVLAGHNHHYERSLVDCVPYFVNGLGGGALHGSAIPNLETTFTYFGQYGAMHIEATEEELNFQFWNIDGEQIDDYSIYSESFNPNPYTCYDLISSSSNLHSDIKWHDANGDMVKDVVYSSNGNLFYAENLSDGTLAESISILETGFNLDLINIADVNLDGTEDYLVMIDDSNSANNSSLIWLLLDSSGQIIEQVDILNSNYSGAIESGTEMVLTEDLNGDGLADILWLETLGCTVRCNINLGEGAFSSDVFIADGACDDLTSVDLADLNGDSSPDILFTTMEQGTYWLENLGDGSFSTEHIEIMSAQYTKRKSPIIIDLESDGDLDLVQTATNETSGNEVLLQLTNSGLGEFSVQEIGEFSLGNILNQETLILANMDNDLFPDFLVKDNSSILWFEYTEGDFSEAVSYPATWNLPFLIQDLNADGLDDLIYSSGLFQKIVWQENLGGDFDVPESLIESTAFYRMEDLFFQQAPNYGGTDLIFRPITSTGQHLFYYQNQFGEGLALGNPGDFNGDGAVNVLDLSIFLAYFGEPCPSENTACLPDFSQDGEVTVQDLGQFLALFGMVYYE